MLMRERVLRLLSAFGAVAESVELDDDKQYPIRAKVKFTVSDADLRLTPKNENTLEYLALPIPVHPITLTLYTASCVVHLYPDYAIISDVKVKGERLLPVFLEITHRNAFYTIAEHSSVIVFDGVKLPDIVHGLGGKYLPLVFDVRIGYLPVFMVEDYNLRFTRPVFIPLPTYNLIMAVVQANREQNMYTNNERLKKFLKEKLPEYKDRVPEELKPLIRGRRSKRR
jgi:hypothetical protein